MRTEVRRTESEKYPPTTNNDRNNNESGPQSIPGDMSGLSPPRMPSSDVIKKHQHKLSSTSTASTTASSTATESGQETDTRTSPHPPPNGARRVSQFQLDSDSSDSDSPDDDGSNTSNSNSKDVNNGDNRTLTSEPDDNKDHKEGGDGHSDTNAGSEQHASADDDAILPLGMSSTLPGSGGNLAGMLTLNPPPSSGIGSVSPTSRASPSSSVSTSGSVGHPHHPHFHHHHQTSFEGSFDRSSAILTGSVPGDLSTGISGLCLNETANQSTMWLGTEDGWYVLCTLINLLIHCGQKDILFNQSS